MRDGGKRLSESGSEHVRILFLLKPSRWSLKMEFAECEKWQNGKKKKSKKRDEECDIRELSLIENL